MNLILRERENWLNDLFKPFFDEEFHNFSVPSDLKENEDSYLVKCDLPGMTEKDIKVELDKGVLTISGERKEEKDDKNDNFYKKEIRYGKFSRSYMLGNSIKVDDIKANFKNGVLEIKIPKDEKSKARLIPLH